MATIIVLSLCVVVFAPLILAWRKPDTALSVALLYGAAGLGLVLYYVPLFVRTDLPALARSNAEVVRRAASGGATKECRNILNVAEQGRIFVDRTSPTRIIVRKRLWTQLPQRVQDVIVGCLEGSRETDSRTEPLEIVQQEG